MIPSSILGVSALLLPSWISVSNSMCSASSPSTMSRKFVSVVRVVTTMVAGRASGVEPAARPRYCPHGAA